MASGATSALGVLGHGEDMVEAKPRFPFNISPLRAFARRHHPGRSQAELFILNEINRATSEEVQAPGWKIFRRRALTHSRTSISIAVIAKAQQSSQGTNTDNGDDTYVL